jgi:HSP20 family protein
MALLPARRRGTLSRPGSQAPARWDPFAESGDLYQRMGQLMSGAFDGGWQPPVQVWAPLADLSETGRAYLAEAGLPGVAKDDISVELAGQAEVDQVTAVMADGVLTVTVPKTEAGKPRRIQVTAA